MRGYFGIGIINGKASVNLGTLWRSAHIFDAKFIFTVGKRYSYQASDTKKTWKSIPLVEFEDYRSFQNHMPRDSKLVFVEQTTDAVLIERFKHPDQAVYLLGAEDRGIPSEILRTDAYATIKIAGGDSLNVAVAGSIVMYDRYRQWVELDRDARLPTWEKSR